MNHNRFPGLNNFQDRLSGPSSAANIFTYYDEIRVFGDTRDNPDYWLQLGIAATVLDDLSRGELCFKNAYSRERARPVPNLTRIDNYFSRFQMRLAVADSDSNSAFATFISANERLERQIFLDINRHYPFKTGRYYSDIAAKHYENWDDKKKARFVEAARKIREKAIEWKQSKREFSTDVEILIKEVTALLKKIDLPPL